MTLSTEATSNGHRETLEAEAMAVIEAVKTEPAVVEPEPQAKAKRKRRSAAEIQAERAANDQLALISVVVDGTQFDGHPDHIARLLNARKQAA
tara:strand:- start:437 stop:715 length:279 start_codon:yes stop_codon:yes gene_type:complete